LLRSTDWAHWLTLQFPPGNGEVRFVAKISHVFGSLKREKTNSNPKQSYRYGYKNCTSTDILYVDIFTD
jgi:hypothetical protein